MRFLFAAILVVISNLLQAGNIYVHKDSMFIVKFNVVKGKNETFLNVYKKNISKKDTLLTYGISRRHTEFYDSATLTMICDDSIIDQIIMRYSLLKDSIFTSDLDDPLCVILWPGDSYHMKYVFPTKEFDQKKYYVDRYQVVNGIYASFFRRTKLLSNLGGYMNIKEAKMIRLKLP